MKKTILGVAILALVLIMMIGSVNAASIAPNNTEIKKGETVKVTVTVDPTSAVQFDLKYDNTKFEYLGASAGSLGDNAGAENAGVVSVAAFALDGTTKTEIATVDFKALETVEKAKFTIEGLVTESMETVAEPTIEVTVVEPTTENPDTPVTPDRPANPEQPGNTEVPGTNVDQEGKPAENNPTNSGIIGTNGKVINKLPQTGTPIFVGAVAIIVVASAILALVIKKVK